MSVEDGRSWDDDGVTPRDPHDEDTGLRRGSGGGRGLHDRDLDVDSGYSSFHQLRRKRHAREIATKHSTASEAKRIISHPDWTN